jgi:hypothetical protein
MGLMQKLKKSMKLSYCPGLDKPQTNKLNKFDCQDRTLVKKTIKFFT